MSEGQVTAGTPEGVNQGGATLDAAVEAELALLEQGDEGENGSQGDNRDEPTDDGDKSDEQDGTEEGEDADSTDADEADDDEAAAGELVDHEHEGKTYRIPKELVPALMKDADYRQKTAQVAEYGRHLQGREQQVNELFQAGQHFVQARAQLEAVESAGREIVQQLAADPNMYETDFVRFGQLTGRLQMLQMQRQGIVGRATQAEQQHNQYQEQQRQQRIAQARPALASVGLTPDVLGKVAQHGLASGMTQEEIAYLDGGNNPALLLMLNESRLYRELMAKQGQVTKQVREAKPIRQVARPGAVSQNNQSGSRDALGKKLKATGAYTDAVALEMAHMQRGNQRRQR